jgi:hypothetical protein
MRGLDLYMERGLADRSNDANVSRSFSREINDLERNRMVQKQNEPGKDKVSFATTSLCMGSPFMLIGLGAALLEEFSEIKHDKQLSALKQGEHIRRPLKASVQSLDRTKMGSPIDQKVSLALLAADMTAIKNRSMVKERKADQAVFMDVRKNRRPFLAEQGKDWLDIKRLAKRKQFLIEQMERMNKGNSFLVMSQLAAKLELIEKELKRLGC